MNRIFTGCVFAATLILAIWQQTPAASQAIGHPLPEFATEADNWIGASPLQREALRGDVALVHIWAYECWNCYRSFPWLNELEARLAKQDLQIIGIHTPEFEREKKRENVAQAMERFEIDHPVMLDNDYRYWRALNNRYWPAWYLVDRKGIVRSVYIGEIHADTQSAREIERELDRLLAKN